MCGSCPSSRSLLRPRSSSSPSRSRTRAVPFPTILEIEDVEQQLTNHKREIRGLLEPGVRTGAELAIAEIYAKEDLIKKEKDRAAKPYVHKLNIIRNDYLRNAILVLLP